MVGVGCSYRHESAVFRRWILKCLVGELGRVGRRDHGYSIYKDTRSQYRYMR